MNNLMALVDMAALKQVLEALISDGPQVRELQACRGVLFPGNPIDTLILNFADSQGKSWTENKPWIDSDPADMGG